MKRVKLRGVFGAHFAKCALTMYEGVKKAHGALKKDEVYIFISRDGVGNQLYFILGEGEVTVRKGTRWERKVRWLDWRGWRIDGGEFSPYLLEDLANRVGLTLGIKNYAQHFARLREAKKAP